ncbi:MAG TPA: hypothetical protein VIO11_08270 [Candidatus Methanoperedens sp.]
MSMESEKKETVSVKDKVLSDLERMLENAGENSKQPIINLINKRKVELGMQKSGLPHAGYKLKKSRKHERPHQTEESKSSLREIAMNVGRIPETRETDLHDIDVKDEPLKKDKKAIEEVDSYKY